MIAIETLALAFVAVFAGLFVLQFVWDRDASSAAGKTRRRAAGVGTGAAGAGVTIGALGLEVVAQLPELAITAVGIGALLAGWSWDVFGAVAVLTWIVAEFINGGA